MNPIFESARILVVDDDGIVRRFVEHTLRLNGHSCTLAASAKEAIELLRKNSYTLVLSDVVMPEVSGLTLLEWIHEQYPETAVVMMTGLDDPSRAVMAAEAGAYSYLVKPFEQNELIVNIRSSLMRHHLEQQIKQQNQLLEAGIREKTESLSHAVNEAITAREEAEEIARTLQGRSEQLQQINQALSKEIEERKLAERERDALHSQLLETSRQVGMAEMATGVLHNVGNVLTSLNVSVNCMTERLRESKMDRLIRAVGMLALQPDDLDHSLSGNEQRRRLTGYLLKVSAMLQADQDEFGSELAGLREHIEHIKEIVAMQRSFGRLSGVQQVLMPAALAEEAIKINEARLQRRGAELIREYEGELPEISTEKHKVLQILVNLLGNAEQAIEHCPEKRITIRIRLARPSSIEFQISDTGIGIPPENLPHLFQHGFTTRKNGHGFGLHSSALSARELGGALTGHSPGTGKGATFTLCLPVQSRGNAVVETERELQPCTI